MRSIPTTSGADVAPAESDIPNIGTRSAPIFPFRRVGCRKLRAGEARANGNVLA
jgi:hypothetical protein